MNFFIYTVGRSDERIIAETTQKIREKLMATESDVSEQEVLQKNGYYQYRVLSDSDDSSTDTSSVKMKPDTPPVKMKHSDQSTKTVLTPLEFTEMVQIAEDIYYNWWRPRAHKGVFHSVVNYIRELAEKNKKDGQTNSSYSSMPPALVSLSFQRTPGYYLEMQIIAFEHLVNYLKGQESKLALALLTPIVEWAQNRAPLDTPRMISPASEVDIEFTTCGLNFLIPHQRTIRRVPA